MDNLSSDQLKIQMKNIWDSMYDISVLNFQNDDFLPIFMLIKVLEIQMKVLHENQKNCKCKHQSPIEFVKNINKELNISDNINSKKKRLLSEIEEQTDPKSDTSIDIVNESFITNSTETSPVLKNKKMKLNKKNVRKKLSLWNIENNPNNRNILKTETTLSKINKPENLNNIQECNNKIKQDSSISKNFVQTKLSNTNMLEPQKLGTKTGENTKKLANVSPQISNESKTSCLLSKPSDTTMFEPSKAITKPPEIANQYKIGNNLQELKNENIIPSKQNIHTKLSGSTVFKPPEIKFPDLDETELDPFAPTYYCPTTPPKAASDTAKIQLLDIPSNSKPSLNDCYIIEDSDDEKNKNLDCNKTDKQSKTTLNNSYDRVPVLDNEPNYAYRRNAVRKKADRLKLKGQTCYLCEKFFKMMGGENEKRYQENVNKCSRHRDNQPPSYTPPGYWKPTF